MAFLCHPAERIMPGTVLPDILHELFHKPGGRILVRKRRQTLLQHISHGTLPLLPLRLKLPHTLIQNPVQLIPAHRLQQIIHGPEPDRPSRIVKIIIGRNHHNFRFGVDFINLFSQITAVLLGEHNIRKNDIRHLLPENLQGLRYIFRFQDIPDMIPLPVNHPDDTLADPSFIIRHKYFHHNSPSLP